MVTLIIFSATLLASAKSDSLPAWAKLLRSDLEVSMVRKPSLKAVVARSPKGAGLGKREADSRSIEDPEILSFLRRGALISKTASELLQEGRSEQAYDYLTGIARREPAIAEAYWVPMVKSEILTRRYNEAFQLMSQRLAKEEYFDEDGYLWLSIASSALGKVYPGQGSYVQRELTKRLGEGRSSVSPIPVIGQPLDAHQVLEESLLAMGVGTEPAYIELLIRENPRNDVAARQLVGLYMEMGKFSAARRVTSSILSQSPSPEGLTFYSKRLKEMNGLKDRPHDGLHRATP